MFIYHNPNPKRRSVGDCVIRAISTVTEQNWDDVFLDIVEIAFHEKDMPSSNSIYGKYLNELGFQRFLIPDQCPDCYTVRDYRGGRYAMRGGRSYDNGYSRHGGDNEYMIRNLEKAMDEATTDKERQMISECIDKLSK